MLYQSTSSKTVIMKVMRDLNMQSDNFVLDAFEWMGEAIEHIGSGIHFEDKITVIQTTSYSASLPTGLFTLLQVAYNPKDPAKVPEKDDPLVGMSLASSNVHPGMYEDQSLISEDETGRDTFYIENGKIKTSFETGYLAIGYSAVATDDDGYPMIPDNVSFKEALFWYILKMLIMRGENPNSEVFNYAIADQKWRYYCTQARNAEKMPDVNKYQQFSENWVSLIPNYDRFKYAFDDDAFDERRVFSTGNWQDVFDAYDTTRGPVATLEADI